MTRSQMITWAAIVFSLIGCGNDEPENALDTETDLATPDAGDTDTESGDETDDSESGVESLEIIGNYTTDFGSSITISETTWLDESSLDGVDYVYSFDIAAYDNNARYIIAKNGADNAYNPSLWSRFDWKVENDSLYYCQSIYDGESEEAATNADDASDPSDLDTGCGGFPWSELIPK